MNATEHQDDNVQSMRDQGIRDACNGYPAFAFHSAHYGALLVANADGIHVPIVPDGSQAYREAFAYARAYEAECVPAVIRGRR